MSTIIVDAATRAKILAAGGAAEVRDEEGKLLGRFIAEPDIPPPEVLAEMEMTAEEYLQAFAPDAKTYTTAEVLEYVRKLA